MFNFLNRKNVPKCCANARPCHTRIDFRPNVEETHRALEMTLEWCLRRRSKCGAACDEECVGDGVGMVVVVEGVLSMGDGCHFEEWRGASPTSSRSDWAARRKECSNSIQDSKAEVR